MKKLRFYFYIILVIVCCSSGMATEDSIKYKYLTNDIRWKVYIHYAECTKPCKYLVEMCVTGDTLIDDVKYRIVDNVPIREDGDKIYCYTWDPLEQKVHEVLIYDYSVKKGDKVRLLIDGRQGSEQTYYAMVTDVEVVTLLDGRKARRISYDRRGTDLEYVGNITCGFSRPFIVEMMADYTYVCCSEGDVLLHEAKEGICAETSDVNDIQNSTSKDKQMLNDGTLYIQHNGKRYNLLGAELK